MPGRPSQSEFRRYAIAVVLVAVMTLIKSAVNHFDSGITPFVIMTFPIVVAAWIGGWGPGLLATALSMLAIRFVIPSQFTELSVIGSVAFVVEGVLISWLADQRRVEKSSGIISREQLRLLHDGIDDCALFILDANGTIDDWNHRAERLFGYAARQIVGKHLSHVYDSADREHGVPDEDLNQARQHGRADVSGWRIRRDGSRFWAETQLTALRERDGQVHGFAHVVSDKTDRKLTEQELNEYRTRLEELVGERTRALHESMSRLRNSERMAALGTLSAGLGHDMGNLLLPIRLRLDAMQSKGIPAGLEEDVASIATCTDYLQRLSNGLRLLSIDPVQANATAPSTDIADWWEDVQPFLRNALPKHIELERRMCAGLPPIAVPRHLLTQAVFNLVQNAGQAIPSNIAGRVCVWAESGADDSTIRLGVTDNGEGMDDEVRARCLEPFFTSKTRAISTGLGLTLVHGVVQQAGGQLKIDTAPGQGTTFTLEFPMARGSSGSGKRTVHRAVVDITDNRMRTYLGAVLRSVGFEVSYGDAAVAGATEARLCVVDAQTARESVSQFLQSGSSQRRLVILGRNPEAHWPDDVVQLDRQPAPAAVRSAFQRIADDLDVKEVNSNREG